MYSYTQIRGVTRHFGHDVVPRTTVALLGRARVRRTPPPPPYRSRRTTVAVAYGFGSATNAFVLNPSASPDKRPGTVNTHTHAYTTMTTTRHIITTRRLATTIYSIGGGRAYVRVLSAVVAMWDEQSRPFVFVR